MPEIGRLQRLDDPALLRGLAALLVDAVDGGASVSFMAPLAPDRALAWWQGLAPAVAAGERLLLVARHDDGRVAGSVQLVLAQPENQPHRADLAKLLVHRSERRSGLGERLMRAAEQAAQDAGKTLLVLDTAGAEAGRLYARLGWQRVGVIPDFALWPDGRPCATTLFFKALAPAASAGH